MKRIEFTEKESVWLTRLLLKRLEYHQQSQMRNTKHERNLKSAVEKLKIRDRYFSKSEKTLCNSVINVHLMDMYRKVTAFLEFDIKEQPAFLQDELKTIDNGKDILVKTGFRDNHYYPLHDFSFRYGSQ